MTSNVSFCFGYNCAGQSVFNLVNFNKVRVMIYGYEIGVRLKHAEVLADKLPGILWDGLALHGFLWVLCLKLGAFSTGLAGIPNVTLHTRPKYDILAQPCVRFGAKVCNVGLLKHIVPFSQGDDHLLSLIDDPILRGEFVSIGPEWL